MLKATEGYRLSKPIRKAVTHLLYIDDLKIFAASREKLRRAMAAVRGAMKDIGLEWNERQCSVAHVKRGTLEPEEFRECGIARERFSRDWRRVLIISSLELWKTLNRMTTLVSRSQARLIYNVYQKITTTLFTVRPNKVLF